MASGTAPTQPVATKAATGTSSRPAERLRKTRRQVRGVELASRLMFLAAAAIGFFLLAAVVDHWLVPGGLGIYGRLALLAAFFIAPTSYKARQKAPR
jgi:hypothetical protein